MSRIKVFRGIVLSIAILYVIKKALVDINSIYSQYAKRSFEFFQQSPELASKYWDILPVQLLTHDLILILIGVIFYYLVKKFEINKRLYLAYLIFLLPSALFGYLLAQYDQLINPYYFLKYPSPIITNQYSLFTHLVIRNSIEFVSLFFLVMAMYRIERTYIRNSSFSRELFELPKSSIFINFFLPIALLILITLESFAGNLQLQMYISWQVLLWSSFLCLLGLTLIVYLAKEIDKVKALSYWKVYELYLGICLTLIVFTLFRKVSFGDEFLTNINDWILYVFLIIGLIPLLSGFVGYKINQKLIVNRLESLNTQSELSNLKSQINPHFLFNSLNSLYGLALEESSPKTSTGIQRLSEMMRFMLRENVEDKIEIRREFEYVENYIELQKLRVDGNEKVRLEYEIDKACEGKTTPMLIIPFIENAFKHGVSAHHNSWIEVKLNCSKEAIHLNVKNSNHKKSKSIEEESGIGLENVRQRLVMLYPGKHLFQLFENEESFEANLKIELN